MLELLAAVWVETLSDEGGYPLEVDALSECPRHRDPARLRSRILHRVRETGVVSYEVLPQKTN